MSFSQASRQKGIQNGEIENDAQVSQQFYFWSVNKYIFTMNVVFVFLSEGVTVTCVCGQDLTVGL